MMTAFQDRLLVVLIALLGLTLVSWRLQAVPGPSAKMVGSVVLLIAFAKARLIVIHYMEATRAAPPVRVAFEAWVWVTGAMVLALY